MQNQQKNIFAGFLIVLSMIGFGDASYLAIRHYQGASVICAIVAGCDKVTASVYATIGNVPVALLGAFYYATVFFLGMWYLYSRREEVLDLAAKFTAVGFFASLWFVYLQLVVIQAICFYCMISAATSTLLFITSTLFLWNKGRELTSHV
jgi:uncharacterized membrane protein